MARPSKPVNLVQGHRTKDELKIRRDAESAMLTHVPMKAQFDKRRHRVAAKEFNRLKKLFAGIGKDDDLYSSEISLHCLLVEECQRMGDEITEAKEKLADSEGDTVEKAKLTGIVLETDKALMAKRKMLLGVDKENILTVQSALRSIPKKPEQKKKSDMAKYIERRAGDG